MSIKLINWGELRFENDLMEEVPFKWLQLYLERGFILLIVGLINILVFSKTIEIIVIISGIIKLTGLLLLVLLLLILVVIGLVIVGFIVV